MSAVKDTDQEMLDKHVNHIVAQLECTDTAWREDYLESKLEDDSEATIEDVGAYDYLDDVLDIEYIVNSKREYLGARVLVAFGGPNIWINTRQGIVEGYWWGTKSIRSFEDKLGIDDILQEYWECT